MGFGLGVVFLFCDLWDAEELLVVVGLGGKFYNPLQDFFIAVGLPKFRLGF